MPTHYNFGHRQTRQPANPAARHAGVPDYREFSHLNRATTAPGTITGLGQAPAPSSASSAASPTPTPQQLTRQPELADAFRQQVGNVTGAGQAALDQAIALAPRLQQIAEEAYTAGVEGQNLDRFRSAVDTASGARKSAVQTTLDNLRKQAQLGFDATTRRLDSQRAALGLPTESTEFHRNLGDAYYRNFLPVEAQALALGSQAIEQDLASENILKNLELQAANQRGAAAANLASGLAQPVNMQLAAVGQLGNALTSVAPVADRAFFNFVQGDDGLPAVPSAYPSYSVPGVQDNSGAVLDAFSRLGFANPQNSAVNLASPTAPDFAAEAARYGVSASQLPSNFGQLNPAQRAEYLTGLQRAGSLTSSQREMDFIRNIQANRQTNQAVTNLGTAPTAAAQASAPTLVPAPATVAGPTPAVVPSGVAWDPWSRINYGPVQTPRNFNAWDVVDAIGENTVRPVADFVYSVPGRALDATVSAANAWRNVRDFFTP